MKRFNFRNDLFLIELFSPKNHILPFFVRLPFNLIFPIKGLENILNLQEKHTRFSTVLFIKF